MRSVVERVPREDSNTASESARRSRSVSSGAVLTKARNLLSVRAARVWFPVAALALTGLVASGCGIEVNTSGDQEGSRPNVPAVTVDEDGKVFNPARIYAETSDGVVAISSVFGENSDPFSPGAAGGSGFVISEDGEIVTNAHVVSDGEGEARTPASEVYVGFQDEGIVRAEIVGLDPFSDGALLSVNPDEADLVPIDLGNSDEVVIGEPIAVIGSPFGSDYSLSTGVVSQTDQSVMSLTDFQIDGAIQTDASINPGNSGGPMINSQGQVIAVSQQMRSQSGSSDGVGFGVPSNTVKASVEQLREDGDVSYAFLGVSTQPLYPQLADKLGLDAERGAIVAEVVPDGPAAKAGIKGSTRSLRFQGTQFDVGGDVVLEADGEKVERAEDLGRIISRLEPGEQVELKILRNGKPITVEVTLGERPTAITQG